MLGAQRPALRNSARASHPRSQGLRQRAAYPASMSASQSGSGGPREPDLPDRLGPSRRCQLVSGLSGAGLRSETRRS